MKVNQWLKRVGAVALSVMMLITMLSVCGFVLAEADPTAVYVDFSTGDDANEGTEASPLKTAKAAVNKVNTLGLTGENRNIIFLGDGVGNLDMSGANAYTENITIYHKRNGNFGTGTLWMNSTAIKLGGPVTIDSDVGYQWNNPVDIYTYGYDLVLGERFSNAKGNSTANTKVYAGFDYATQAATTPTANGRYQLGRDNNLTVNSNSTDPIEIYYGNKIVYNGSYVPVQYGNAKLVLNTKMTIAKLKIGISESRASNDTTSVEGARYEGLAQFTSLKIKVDNVGAISSFVINSYQGGVGAGSVQAIFNNGTWDKTTTNNFSWAATAWTQDGIATSNSYVMKSASTEAALDFTDTVGTFAVTEGYTATAGEAVSANGKLVAAKGTFDVTFAKATTTTEESTTEATTATTAAPAVTLTADKTTVAPGETIRFTIGNLGVDAEFGLLPADATGRVTGYTPTSCYAQLSAGAAAHNAIAPAAGYYVPAIWTSGWNFLVKGDLITVAEATTATTTTTTVATTTTSTTVATTTSTSDTTTTTTTTQGGGTTPSVAGGVYVDTINGDDTAAGTEAAPLKTLKAAINKVNALGLTGDARNVIFKGIDATNTAQSDLTGVDAYTENITISCANPSTTIWFDSNTLKLGGPLTINAIIGKPFNEAMTIRTYGFDLTLDERFTDVYYAKRESGVEIYAGYDHAVQALTPDENKYIQLGRNNNLTIKGNKEYTVSIWFGNVSEVGNPVVYGDANILIDNPNLTIGMFDIGNNGNYANSSSMWESHTQFKSLTIKVQNANKIGTSGGANFRVNSYNGGVKVGTLKAIFNNGTWAKTLTNNFTWSTTDWTKDGFVTADAYVVKAEDYEDAELDFTDTLGTYSVTDGYVATATGNIKSVMGELIVGAGVFDVTFGDDGGAGNLPTGVDVEALVKEAATKHSYHNKSTAADVKAAVSAALDAAGFGGFYTLDVKDWYLIRAVAGAKDQDGVIWEGYKGYASATIVVGGYVNATVDFIGTVEPTLNEYTFNGVAKQEEPFHPMTEADAENGVDTDFYLEFYPGCQITYFNDGEYFIVSEDGKTLISYCGEAEKIIFPEGVERLLNAYDDDGEDWWLETTVENVRCLILPTTLKEIPDMFGRAFRSTLECVIMYDDVTTMDGWRTFMECYYLSTLRLSENLENLPQESLFQLLSLYDLRLPTGLKTIGKGAMHLSNIRDIYVPAGVEVITAEAFAWPVRKLQHLASRPQGNQVAQEVVDELYPAFKEAIWRDPNDAETYIMRSIYIITDDAEYKKDEFGTASYWNSNWAVQAVRVYYIDGSTTDLLLESGYTGSTDGCCTETEWEMSKPQVLVALSDAADRLQITADTTEADLLKQFNNMVYSTTVTNLTLKNVVIDNDELSASGEVWGTVNRQEVLLITFDKTMMARPSVPTAPGGNTTTTTTQGSVTTTTVVVTTTTVGETTTTTATTGGEGGAETPDTGYEVPVMMILVVMATAFAAVYFLRKKAAV